MKRHGIRFTGFLYGLIYKQPAPSRAPGGLGHAAGGSGSPGAAFRPPSAPLLLSETGKSVRVRTTGL
jgi:hypothetical protein